MPRKLHWLRDSSVSFPPIEDALDDPPGLLAVGGDLRPARLLQAYAEGIFPWFEEGSPILWWSPDPRMVLRPAAVHVSRSLRRRLRRGDFEVTMDRDFAQVIHQCAELRRMQEGTWITEEMANAYRRLHEMNEAHSVEVWSDETLIGGLYGVAMGPLFFGESMFSRCHDGSKIALVALCRQLEQWQFQLIDCQLPTRHLASMGGEVMSRHRFRQILDTWRNQPGHEGPWHFDAHDALTRTRNTAGQRGK